MFLLQKGWKKQGPSSLRHVDSGGEKRDYVAQEGEIRKQILITRLMERVRINGKLTKTGKRNRAMLKEECKSISAAELVSYMEKQKSLLRKLESNFIEDRSKTCKSSVQSSFIIAMFAPPIKVFTFSK